MPKGLYSSLHWPADPSWEIDTDFSSTAAQLLTLAYGHIKHADTRPHACADAYLVLAACSRLAMSTRQRLQLVYAQAMVALRIDRPATGIELLLYALGLAEELVDDAAYVELAYLLGAAEQGRSRYRAAAAAQQYSLDRLRELADGEESADPNLETRVLIALCVTHFILDDQTFAAEKLDEAQRMAPAGAQTALDTAPIEWMRANLYRWGGQPDHALKHALIAADAYMSAESPVQLAARGRTQTLVADITLDIVETFPDNEYSLARDMYLSLAGPYVRRAVIMSRAVLDPAGEWIARLARARWERMTHRDTDRVRIIEMVLRAGERAADTPMACQGRTALADEYASRGDESSALTLYRSAWEAAKEHDMRAHGTRARRALLLAGEMRIDVE